MTGYDDIIDDYLVHVERPGSWNNLFERPNLKKLLPTLAGKRILDLGCASGHYTEYALEQGASVTAIDISRAWTDRLTRQTDGSDLRVVTADISQPMPFLESEAFDCIIASLVIHYLRDWQIMVTEMYRVLKPGGTVVISTHHPCMTLINHHPVSIHDCYEVEETWAQKSDRPFKVRFYIRSLTDTLRPFIESPFRIELVEEPVPELSLESTHPELYRRLVSEPTFLFIVLRK